MKPKDLFFIMILKYKQSCCTYFHKKGDGKNFTAYLCTKEGL